MLTPASQSSQLTDTIEISAGLCIISLLYFIFPPLSINKAEAAKAVLWMMPGGNSFSSMNIFNSYKNTARNERKPQAEAFLCPGCHLGQGVVAQDGLLGARLLPLGFLCGSWHGRLECAAPTEAEEPLKGAQTRGPCEAKGQQRWRHGNAPPAELQHCCCCRKLSRNSLL